MKLRRDLDEKSGDISEGIRVVIIVMIIIILEEFNVTQTIRKRFRVMEVGKVLLG
jgi:hypothetical protein